MAPRGLSQKSNKKDKKKVGFTEEQKSKVYSTKVPVLTNLENIEEYRTL